MAEVIITAPPHKRRACARAWRFGHVLHMRARIYQHILALPFTAVYRAIFAHLPPMLKNDDVLLIEVVLVCDMEECAQNCNERRNLVPESLLLQRLSLCTLSSMIPGNRLLRAYN